MSLEKPVFSKTMLWAMILILIPLIAVLNSLGDSPDSLSPPAQVEQQWQLAQLPVRQQQTSLGLMTHLPLATDQINVWVALSALPVTQFVAPEQVRIQTQYRSEQLLVSFTLPVNDSAWQSLLWLLEDWATPDFVSAVGVMGPVQNVHVQALTAAITAGEGVSVPLTLPSASDVTRIASPATGTVEQIAFLLAKDHVLNQLSGYRIQQRWQHATSPSYLLINRNITDAARQPMSPDTLQARKQAMLQAAQQPRDIDQLTRYLAVMVAESLPASFLTEQTERIQAVTLPMVNEQIQRMQ